MFWFWAVYGVLFGVGMFLIVATALVGLRSVPDLRFAAGEGDPEGNPRLSVIVPAKNEEEGIGACLASFLDQSYDNFEVIAVNDRSTDSTGEIMEKIRVARPPSAAAFDFKILHITELPPGWLGKQHAMWSAAKLATGELLLFTDGDVMFGRDSLRRAVAYAQAERADHLVLAPTMLTLTFGEKLITGMIQMAIIGLKPWRVSDPKSRAFIGWGAFNLVRRSAYDAIGGMEPLRLCVVEDMELGRRIKRAGLRARFAFGPGLVQLRWGRGLLGPVNNLTKNAFAGVGFRIWLVVALVLATLAAHVLPFALIWFAPGWTKLGFALGLASLFAVYARLRTLYGIHPLFFFLNPVGAGLMCYAMLRSLFVTLRQGGITWRGTKYSLEELRAASPKPWD